MEEKNSVDILIDKAKTDFLAREKIFHEYRPEIKSIASSICKRNLSWDNDDELSISLIAFNEAIDTYDKSKGMKFISYARMLIHNRLVDYFRSELRFQHSSLNVVGEEHQVNEYEKRQAFDEHRKKQENESLSETMEIFDSSLLDYGISLDDLVKISPKHRDTRHMLMKVAQSIVNERILLSKLKQSKRLPIKELKIYTGLSRRTLERGRKYIIALALILSDDNYSEIKNFINFPNTEGGEKL
jgi:RNA polymerase sigma factor